MGDRIMFDRRRRRAFTLVEVLVVLVILVLLFGMVGPRILGSQQKADIKKTQLDIGNLGEALKLYSIENRSFPSSEDGLDALLSRPGDEQMARNWDGPYLESDVLPVDPWGNSYRYEYPPKEGKRDFPNIWSPGKDGQDNTDDDIVNWNQSGPKEDKMASRNDGVDNS